MSADIYIIYKIINNLPFLQISRTHVKIIAACLFFSLFLLNGVAKVKSSLFYAVCIAYLTDAKSWVNSEPILS